MTQYRNFPRDAEGPVFAEPWQAQAFALAVKLSEQGHFTWKECHNFGRRAQVRCRFAGNLTTVLITSNTGSPRSHVSCPRMFNAQDPNSHITQFMVLVPAGRRTLGSAGATLRNPPGNWPKCLAVVERMLGVDARQRCLLHDHVLEPPGDRGRLEGLICSGPCRLR